MNLNDGLYIGVDGCRGGWITCVLDHGGLRFERFDSMEELVFAEKVILENGGIDYLMIRSPKVVK